jgi:hypothetical protein
MRFIIMHKSNAHWESGAIPGPELIARVGTLLGELAKAGALLAAEGLRASSDGEVSTATTDLQDGWKAAFSGAIKT